MNSNIAGVPSHRSPMILGICIPVDSGVIFQTEIEFAGDLGLG